MGRVRCSEDEKEHSECDGEHKFLSGNQGNLCVKEFRLDSTPPVQKRGERLKWITEGMSSAPRRLTHQPRRFPRGVSAWGPIVA